jgi:hypothetical protein
MWRIVLRWEVLFLVAAGCGRSGLPIAAFAAQAAGAAAPIATTAEQARADKIDLLFVIDDSGSMRDKQQILARAVPDLVDRLTNPLCVDPNTLAPASKQPSSALAPCAAGSVREFNAVQDLHIGVVSTSLGGVGAASCGVGFSRSSANDHAHLIAPRNAAAKGRNFLVWDPAQTAQPHGERDPAALRAAVSDLVLLVLPPRRSDPVWLVPSVRGRVAEPRRRSRYAFGSAPCHERSALRHTGSLRLGGSTR